MGSCLNYLWRGMLMKKFFLIIIAALMALLQIFSSGCATSAKSAPAQQENQYSAIDDTGKKIDFARKPMRIISLTYGTDEILAELVELGRIKAFSRWAGDDGISFITPEEAASVGAKVYDNLEAILALEPDLVVGSYATSAAMVQSLEQAGIKVYIARSPHDYEEMRAKIFNLALAVGEREQGEALLRRMDERLHKLEAKLSKIPDEKRKVAIAFNFSAPMGRRGDLLDNMLRMAHVINGAAAVTPPASGHGAVVLSKEMVVNIDPDFFLLPTWNYNGKQDVEGYAENLLHDPAYKYLKAVRNKQIKFVSDKYRYVASQHIVEAVENIARAAYPEYFAEAY